MTTPTEPATRTLHTALFGNSSIERLDDDCQWRMLTEPGRVTYSRRPTEYANTTKKFQSTIDLIFLSTNIHGLARDWRVLELAEFANDHKPVTFDLYTSVNRDTPDRYLFKLADEEKMQTYVGKLLLALGGQPLDTKSKVEKHITDSLGI